eukprot:TRINITY_DN32491_c0_g1_i3.p1 TRINITY_DN32491_c0_g1~~TRINITY_DN32491_c0_g1_i3.p1  ORF type:complete len:289 (-),score=57.56 TRINITY_DN32491_c0_g1_i3:424-1290(-)
MHTPFLVRFVYGSIKECSMDEANLFFKIGFSDQDVMFDVTRVSSILNVRLPNNGPKSVSDSLSIAKMTVITETLCGAVIPWEDGGYLSAFFLLPLFKILHNIFTFNVYPRRGNRSDLTPYMANVLYHVATGVKLCLPSLIVGSIVRFWFSPGRPTTACPFGTLITAIAKSCGIPLPAIEKPEFHALLGKGHLAQARLPSPENQRHQASTSLNDPIQEGEHAEEHPSQASHAPSFGDRLTNLEWDMTAMRKDLGDMKKKQSTWMKKIFQYLSKISKRYIFQIQAHSQGE